MPSFFAFNEGSETRGPTNDSTPLLGRFRAVPERQGRRSHRNSILNFSGTGTFGRGISGIFGNESDSEDDFEDEDVSALRRWGRIQKDLWLEPKQVAVGRLVDRWWSRWAVLILLPAALVSYLQQ